jgi:hypothetical protein
MTTGGSRWQSLQNPYIPAFTPALQFLEETFALSVGPALSLFLQELGLAKVRINMSALQILFWLRSRHPSNRLEVIRTAGSSSSAESVRSESTLVSEILEDDLMWAMRATKLLVVSPKGIALLARLHPAFADIEFKSRVARWENDWPSSKVQIGQYFQSLAVKQSRFAAI